jgi:hypothetical protein
MAFRYVAYRSVFASNHPEALIAVNGSLVSRLDQFFSPGTVIQLASDSVQADQSGRSRFEFLAWSDGGSRVHSVTARETPDTIVAQMAAQHRLRMSVQGGPESSVSFALAGDIANGVFLAEGSGVTLRATPHPGSVFAGWTGDTVTVTDTLTLQMLRPFDLTANFVQVREVALAEAANVLFGNALLAPEQVSYLDVVGNRNGVYDLGDFLAAVVRTGGQSPDTAAQALIATGGPK